MVKIEAFTVEQVLSMPSASWLRSLYIDKPIVDGEVRDNGYIQHRGNLLRAHLDQWSQGTFWRQGHQPMGSAPVVHNRLRGGSWLRSITRESSYLVLRRRTKSLTERKCVDHWRRDSGELPTAIYTDWTGRSCHLPLPNLSAAVLRSCLPGSRGQSLALQRKRWLAAGYRGSEKAHSPKHQNDHH